MIGAMSESCDTKYALITGGGSGLGRAFSLQLAREGWHIAVADIDPAASAETVKQIQHCGGTAQAAHLDVSDYHAWQNLRVTLQQTWPHINLLINNAGICAAGEVGSAPVDHFEQVLRVNLNGVLYGCQCIVPWLKERGRGAHVVNISSIFGFISAPSMGAYCTAKAAVVALSETLYTELRPHGVGVTVVSPGFFPSNLIEKGTFSRDAQRKVAADFMDNARMTAEMVVAKTLRAVKKRHLYVVVGRRAGLYWRLKRLLPTTVTKIALWRHHRKMLEFESKDEIGSS